jgi:probable phosphoglycerate mutase
MDEPSLHRQQVVLVRHGETEWSRDGRHTGRTDVPLTEHGRRQAAQLACLLRGRHFAKVLVSPRQRALETCRLAGFGDVAEIRDDLAEWDYGDYEGRTTEDILAERPGWRLWHDGVPGGETVEDVGRRVESVLAEVRMTPGDVAIFAHGHVLRILTARWLGLEPRDGQLFALDPAGVSVLGYEHTSAVIARWNETPVNENEEAGHDVAAAL